VKSWVPAFVLLALAAGCHDSVTTVINRTGGPILVPVDSGYDFSLFVTAPPGDTSRLFVVERPGRILIRKHGVRQDSAFLNLTALTGGASEYGVYSIAFHPNYPTNHYCYVYYVDNNGATQVSRFTADSTFDHADPASEHSLLNVPQAPQAVLYGGLVAFGPDGKFYIAVGDGDADVDTAETSLSQDSLKYQGKLLRVDVDAGDPYGIPVDNPYVARAGWLHEIWQLGLRNPWRWSFDRRTGDVWIGDVGQHVWEEIDYLAAGAKPGNNFGWPLMEGDVCYRTACDTAGLVRPVFEYPHNPACAVTGGYVYRGKASPSLTGVYFYGDYCAGWVRGLKNDGGTLVDAFTPLEAPLINDNVVSFGEDASGEVYVVMASGRIYRISQ